MQSTLSRAKTNQSESEDDLIKFITMFNVRNLLESDEFEEPNESKSIIEDPLINKLKKIRQTLLYGILCTKEHAELEAALHDITEAINDEENPENKKSIYNKVTDALTWIYHKLLSFVVLCTHVQYFPESFSSNEAAGLRVDEITKVSETSYGFFSYRNTSDEVKPEQVSHHSILVYS